MRNIFAGVCGQIPARRGRYLITLGFVAITVTLATTPSALAQQPLSINEWLQAERGNKNLERAFNAYEQAKAGPIIQTDQTQGGVLPQRTYTPNTTTVQVPVFDEQRIKDFAAGADSGRSGVYVAGHIGNAFVMDSDYDADGTTLTTSMKPLGLYSSGAVGLDWENGFSTEVALSYQSAGLEDLALTGIGGFSVFSASLAGVDGSMSALSLMGNGKLEFGSKKRLSPYIMGGIGLSRVAIDDVTASGATGSLDDEDFVFAYQVGAGIMVPLSERTSVDLGYRYFGTSEADMSDGTDDFTAGFSSHTVLVGIKYGL